MARAEPDQPALVGETALVVDDNADHRALMSALLRNAGAEVFEAATGAEALELTRERQPSLALLDVRLPDVHGFDVCRRIKSDPALAATVVVHVSAADVDLEARVTGLESGADAYLTASTDPQEVIAVLRSLLRRRRDELVRQQSVADAALVDSLTGVGNRRAWDAWLAETQSNENAVALVFVIDLDGLKRVNDEQGHAAGDEMIRRAAHAIRGASRSGDRCARLGGDEFGLLAINCRPGDAGIVADRVLQELASRDVGASIGHCSTADGRTINDAWVEADRRMYAMKRRSAGGARQTGRRWSDPPRPHAAPG